MTIDRSLTLGTLLMTLACGTTASTLPVGPTPFSAATPTESPTWTPTEQIDGTGTPGPTPTMTPEAVVGPLMTWSTAGFYSLPDEKWTSYYEMQWPRIPVDAGVQASLAFYTWGSEYAASQEAFDAELLEDLWVEPMAVQEITNGESPSCVGCEAFFRASAHYLGYCVDRLDQGGSVSCEKLEQGWHFPDGLFEPDFSFNLGFASFETAGYPAWLPSEDEEMIRAACRGVLYIQEAPGLFMVMSEDPEALTWHPSSILCD